MDVAPTLDEPRVNFGLEEPAEVESGMLALEEALLLKVGSPWRSKLPAISSSSPLDPECTELVAEMRRPRFRPTVTSRSSDKYPYGENWGCSEGFERAEARASRTGNGVRLRI